MCFFGTCALHVPLEFISDINRNSPDRLHELYLSTKIVRQAITAQDQIIKKNRV